MIKTMVSGANEEYVQQTVHYGRTDALLAFGVFVIMLFLFGLVGKVYVFLNNNISLSESYIFYITGITSLFLIALVFLLCSIRKQKLRTIGFSKTHAIKSLGMGILLSIIVIVAMGIIPVVSGSGIQTDVGLIAMRIINYLNIYHFN